MPWKFHPRNANFEPSTSNKQYISVVNLVQNGTDPANLLSALDGDVDESYSLELTTSGTVTITASTSIGIVRGLTTFSQLFFEHSAGGSYTNLAPVSIQDAPKFAHRGLNMDVARSWFEVSDIKRMIDAVAFSKFNRFHIHATDAQSWPLEIPALPELTEKGAYRKDLKYSPDQIKDIQYYGALLGVQVYIEIDMPGHTSSIAFSHPDLIAAFNVQPDWDTYAAEPPSGTLKLNSTAVPTFLEMLMNDLLPRVKPYTGYFHAGGDEVNVNAYLLDDTVQSNDTAVLQPLMQKFVDRNLDQIRAQGLTPILWEEMLLTWNLTLGDDVLIQSWQSDEAVAQVAGSGHKVIAGNYNYWVSLHDASINVAALTFIQYLDCGQGQWLDFTPGLASEKYWPYPDYCSPRKNWRLMYSYDPLEGVPATSGRSRPIPSTSIAWSGLVLELLVRSCGAEPRTHRARTAARSRRARD